jgi:hypothetical protein
MMDLTINRVVMTGALKFVKQLKEKILNTQDNYKSKQYYGRKRSRGSRKMGLQLVIKAFEQIKINSFQIQ